jgi:outer membrane cobalamin receptor
MHLKKSRRNQGMNKSFSHRLFTKTIGLGLMISLALGSGSSAVAWADESELPVYEEEEVVITATRTKQEESKAPGKTEVITKEEIEASGAATVAEVLQREGVVISSYGGASGSATVQLDGATAKQTLILVNGIPANAGCLGELDLSYFPTAGVQKIEIAHGPLSSLYGANALGGVVNIITDLTSDTPLNQVTLSGGSNQYGQLGLTFQRNKFGIALGGRMSDGYRTYSKADNRFLMSQYDLVQNERDSLIFNFMYKAKKNQFPGSLTWLSNDDQFEETTSLDITGRHNFNDWVFEYKVFNQYINSEYEDNTYFTFSRHRANNYGANFAGVYNFENHELISGLMLKQEDFDSTNSGEHTWQSGAVFVQDNWKLHEKWQLVSGLRWDTGSQYSSPLCPRVNLNYLYSENLVLKIGYGKAFRAPTIHELYWSDYGNPNLQPEEGERYDLTGEWRQDRQSVILNLFYADIHNEISTLYDQAHNFMTHTNGANINWKKAWNESFSTGLQYAWQDKKAWSETTQSYSTNKNDFGKNRYTLNMGYQWRLWSTNLNWNLVTERNNDLPDYSVCDLIFNYQVNPKLKYQLSIANLTDEAYQVISGYPMPGREYYLTANYKL